MAASAVDDDRFSEVVFEGDPVVGVNNEGNIGIFIFICKSQRSIPEDSELTC